MMRRRFLFTLVALVVAATTVHAGETHTVTVAFDYAKQDGYASNQFAVWVEDMDGKLVKTLVATHFTAGRGGYKKRANSLPQWVKTSNIASMAKRDVDAVTASTPAPGRLSYTWNGADKAGEPVKPGQYRVVLEASLRNDDRAVYQTVVNFGGDSAEVAPEAVYEGNGLAERSMIRNVVVVTR